MRCCNRRNFIRFEIQNLLEVGGVRSRPPGAHVRWLLFTFRSLLFNFVQFHPCSFLSHMESTTLPRSHEIHHTRAELLASLNLLCFVVMKCLHKYKRPEVQILYQSKNYIQHLPLVLLSINSCSALFMFVRFCSHFFQLYSLLVLKSEWPSLLLVGPHAIGPILHFLLHASFILQVHSEKRSTPCHTGPANLSTQIQLPTLFFSLCISSLQISSCWCGTSDLLIKTQTMFAIDHVVYTMRSKKK